MDEWTRYQETSLSFWSTLETACWWSFETPQGTVYVLARALLDPERFAIVLSDLKSTWTCEGGVAAVQTLHADYNRGLETDTRGMTLHIDKLISDFDPAATYEFSNSEWRAKTLLANVYRFQCHFACTVLPESLGRQILQKYLLGALFTALRTQEAIIDRQQALLRTLEGAKGRMDSEADARRLTQDIVRQRASLGRFAKAALSEVIKIDVSAVDGRMKARENELKRKRAEDLQKQAEMAKKPKVAPEAAPKLVYEETPDEIARRLELEEKLKKAEPKKKAKRMDFL